VRRLGLAFILLGAPAEVLTAQADSAHRAWNRPVAPARIIGNIYYVGAAEITAFLITGADGHILLDGGFAETAPLILANIERLGFRPADVKVLLNSQAHFDHAGGLAALKRRTGARLLAGPGDAELLERGGRGDFFFGETQPYPPVRVDGRLRDGEMVRIGTAAVTARLTPGHTRGCTTWTARAQERGRTYDVVFVCSLSILDGYRLAEPESYPGIARDFARSIATVAALPCDVFLGAHGSMFRLEDKLARLQAGGGSNPFVGSGECRAYADGVARTYREVLVRQGATPP
jgi:metallo-beta-lactamase class B